MSHTVSIWLVSILFASLSELVGLGGSGSPSNPPVGPGLEYIHRQIGDRPMAIFIVKVDRHNKALGLATTLANDNIAGLETVGDQAEGFDRNQGKPVAAVNGDFFIIRVGLYQGDPTGLQIVDGELVSRPHTRSVSFWIDENGKPHANQVVPRFHVTWPGGTTTTLWLNEDRSNDRATLFTPTFASSTRTPDGREYVLERSGDGPWLPLRAGRTYTARVREVRESGNTAIASDAMVLSIGPKLASAVPAVSVGQELKLSTATRPDLRNVNVALGGGPLLVSNGRRLYAPSAEAPRHPRTVIGWNDDFYFLIVVDGRRPGHSIGMTYPELGELCTELGCTTAMNLDGGGSSTLWVGGQVVNRPSDGHERRVANALIVYQKKK